MKIASTIASRSDAADGPPLTDKMTDTPTAVCIVATVTGSADQGGSDVGGTKMTVEDADRDLLTLRENDCESEEWMDRDRDPLRVRDADCDTGRDLVTLRELVCERDEDCGCEADAAETDADFEEDAETRWDVVMPWDALAE